MLLMTKELEEKLNQYPIGSQDELGEDAEVIVKYFNPCGADTWLITEGEKSVRLPFGLGIERELYVTGAKVKDYL